MKTHPIKDDHGVTYAFEVESVYIAPRKIAVVFSSLPDVSAMHIRKAFSIGNENYVEFKYQGRDFIVWEPYGDSSRYWIGPKDASSDHVDIADLEKSIKQHQPAILRRIIGEVVTLNLFRS